MKSCADFCVWTGAMIRRELWSRDQPWSMITWALVGGCVIKIAGTLGTMNDIISIVYDVYIVFDRKISGKTCLSKIGARWKSLYSCPVFCQYSLITIFLEIKPTTEGAFCFLTWPLHTTFVRQLSFNFSTHHFNTEFMDWLRSTKSSRWLLFWEFKTINVFAVPEAQYFGSRG